MIFTNTDKALMMRAARHLATQAKTLEGNCGTNWARDKDSRRFKLEFDRFLRDERDLRELAKRLEKLSREYGFSVSAKPDVLKELAEFGAEKFGQETGKAAGLPDGLELSAASAAQSAKLLGDHD